MIVTRICRLLSLVLIPLLLGCAAATLPPPPDNLDVVRSWITPQWPQSKMVYRTTSGKIYITNLNASISSLERIFTNRPTANTGIPLADKLYHRYKILGRLEDAETALSTIGLVTAQPDATSDSYLVLAKILTGFHLFTDAVTALERATILNGKTEQIASLAREIDMATGNYPPRALTNNNYRQLITNAHLSLLQGDFMEASSNLRKAELGYSGTNPYVLAWIQLQQGIAFLRYGDVQTANHFFNLAHTRLPQYYLATEHLAESELLLGNTEAARQLYQSVSEQTKSPVFYAQLAKAQAMLGDDSGSQHSASLARAGFQDLLELHPESVGDHAVTFYLDQGENKMALKIARQNIGIRHNFESWIMLAESALATGEIAEACDAWSAANQLGVHPVELRTLAGTMTGTC
jgi:tetratricopeptide (TPR) repeat protein